MVVFAAQQYLALGQALFVAAGASEANAKRVTASLVSASLAGHDSHGVIRFVQYVKAIEAGHVRGGGRPRIVKESDCSALVDGDWTFGQVGAELCMKTAIEKSKQQGVALCGLVRSYHIGRLGEYSEMACDAGVIGMVAMGGFGGKDGRFMSGVAPYGGARASFSTNPISFGLPAGEMPPVMVDFATSSIAGGKISLARAKGETLPPNCILDCHGNPTIDPEDYCAGGAMLPFGGHKGYGLAVVIEILGQALTGSRDYATENPDEGVYAPAGAVCIAVNPGIFRPAGTYARDVDATINRIKDTPPAPGFDEVLLPGEPEQRSRARKMAEGISIPDSSWEATWHLAIEYGIDIDAMMTVATE